MGRFFERMAEHDVQYDLIALSYCPWWHGTFDDLARTLDANAERFGQHIVLVETATLYEAGCERGKERRAVGTARWLRGLSGGAEDVFGTGHSNRPPHAG